MLLNAPTLALHVASLACLLGAFDGAYGVLAPRGAARGPGLDLAADASLTPLRAGSASRFCAHAATLAVIWTAPAVGACFAAALGAGWLGAAGGRALSVVREGSRRADVLRLLGCLAMGVVLWTPLWLYLRAIEAASLRAYGA